MTAPVFNQFFPLADLITNTANPRTITARGRADLAASIARHGYVGVFVARLLPDGTHRLLSGHQCLHDLLARGATTAPCWIVTCTDADEQRLVITLNGHAGEWDDAKLTILLRDLANADEQLDNLMIDAPALDRMIRDLAAKQNPGDPDAVPTVPADPITRLGDVWALGDHRLICGDSTDNDVLDALMPDGEQADLLLTDPPYNVAYTGKTDAALTIANDDMDAAAYQRFLVAALAAATNALAPGAAFYVWHADSEGLAVRTACDHVDLPVRQCLIWVKNSLVLGRQDYQWRHEPCLYGWKPGAAHTWLSDRSQTTVLEFDRPARNDDHPTMKPVALIAYLVGNSCPTGGVVLDPFGGSGTTLIACEQLGRHARLVELDPRYCDVIVRRWESLTGKTAVRIAAPAEGADAT